MKLIVDRIEAGKVVCEKEDGSLLLIDLPGAKEGDVLVETENGFAVDPEETIARRERMLARTRKIRRRRER